MLNYEYLGFFTVVGVMLLVGLFIFWRLYRMWRQWKSNNPQIAPTISKLFKIFLTLQVILFFIGPFASRIIAFNHLFDWSKPLFAPIYFAAEILPVMAAICIVWRVKPGLGAPIVGPESVPSEEELQRIVEKVTSSDRFLKVLGEILPKGSIDADYGIDHIPYVLVAVRTRRAEFARKADSFFKATVALGGVFVIVLILLGYVLVNEAASGSARKLVQLEEETRSIELSLNVLKPSYADNRLYTALYDGNLRPLASLRVSSENLILQSNLASSIDQLPKEGKLKELKTLLDEAAHKMIQKSDDDVKFNNALIAASDKLGSFLLTQQALLPRLDESANELRKLIPDVEKSLEKPENRISELIKRLGLGIVIASFMLALLRYVASLYKINYDEVSKADYEELAIRQLVLALRLANVRENPKDRSAVIAALVKRSSVTKIEKSDQDLDLSKEQSAVLKEFFEALLKKL